jgi:hypothetical protein
VFEDGFLVLEYDPATDTLADLTFGGACGYRHGRPDTCNNG